MQTRLIEGNDAGYFDRGPTVIRKGAILTTSYALCEAHNVQNVRRNGDINIKHATHCTLLADLHFGDTPATSFEILPVYVPRKTNGVSVLTPAAITTGVILLTNLASTQASEWLIVTSGSNPFAEWMVGHYLHINSGTNFNAGSYKITGYTSPGQITIESACGDTGNASDGVGGVAAAFQEMSFATVSGLSTLSPHYLQAVAADCGGAANAAAGGRFCWTWALPAMPTMRIYIKGTGTLTKTSAHLEYLLSPPGSV